MRISGSSAAFVLALVPWPGPGALEAQSRADPTTFFRAGFRSFFWVVPDRGLAIIANFSTSPAPEVSAKDARPNTARVFNGLMDRFAALARATPAVPGR